MLEERGLYYPTREFKQRALVHDENIYAEAEKNPVAFWEKLAEKLFWFKKWEGNAFEHSPPFFKWFAGAKTNITTNIFEKNVLGWEKIRGKKALIWEPEPIQEKPVALTFDELFRRTNQFANALKKLGVKKGDRVSIYLPMIPEAIVAMLACARIGAVHSVVFSAFSPQALKSRIEDAQAKVLITADGYWRRGKAVDLKTSADESAAGTSIEKTIVVKRLGNEVRWNEGRDYWFEELVRNEKDFCEAEVMDAEDLLFILYTSGSTGKPKGTMHACGGYTVQAFWTAKWIFDLHEDDVMWCTSDIGWVTGHTYVVYAPLLNGITSVVFEGVPDYPTPDRWAQIIEKHGATVFYTAPTAIRMFKKTAGDVGEKHEFKKLRVLGSVGEPIDEESWLWYFENVGKKRCPIVDTWWQTETGGILISSLPGVGPFKPTFAGKPFPGVKARVFDNEGKECKTGESGNLVLLPPFPPGLLRGIYKNPEKYRETYWKEYGDSVYFTSDGAFIDENGLVRIFGRVDDVIKVAGHRLSTGEMENAIEKLAGVSECAVAAVPDEIKGEAPVVFAVLKIEPSLELKQKIVGQVRKEIGPIATPKEVFFVEDLPKTRSGKIMRRILRKLFMGEELGDLSTLSNPESVDKIRKTLGK
ncbi:MAG: acetate--CoA ligase [Candidatus Norongarragalinales archaeon]